ncbi:putative MarR family transcription regulator [Sphaerotilus hippei]|uniref:Putative MarR family transcription regulator n=1 Tax=Sphaerotilus hippei TaxID=744406 RepID=A0A318H622_9BURK|nr:putative MarR family transcription regulator [Sphaerotilus hippei]
MPIKTARPLVNSGSPHEPVLPSTSRTARSGPAERTSVRRTARAADVHDAPADGSHFVSSSHLVSPRSVELSELEFGMTVSWNAFSRWVVRCMAAAGRSDLTSTEVLLLHHVNHRARNKKLADICFVLNFEDTHVVTYALRKLVTAGLVQTDKVGKEVYYSPTAEGEALALRYREVRESCLIDALDTELNRDIGELARLLRSMAALYDQAARAASSL